MSFSLIPKCKQGKCHLCNDGVIKQGRKVGKDFVCMQHYNKQKSEEYTEKSKLNKINSLNSGDTSLDQWFGERHKEMTGECVNCNRPTITKVNPNPKIPLYWKYSVAHILPKSLFHSIATHPLNFIELCYFENSCHTNFDNNGFEYAKEKMPVLWNIIVARFKILYPCIAEDERKKIPDVLLETLKNS